MFHYKAFTLDRAVEILYLPNDEGVFGFLMGIPPKSFTSTSFCAVLLQTGAGTS